MKQQLVLFVKAPVAGKVKTRLTPPFSPSEAAEMYKSWCSSIYQKVSLLEGVQVTIAYDPDPSFPTPVWICPQHLQISFFRQEGKDLGERIQHAIGESAKNGAEKIVIIGSDSPELPLEYIIEGFKFLDQRDLVLGPAEDGGYYLIGLKSGSSDGLFKDVAWSTGQVLNQTLANSRRLGLSSHLLPRHFDVDTPEDVERLNNPWQGGRKNTTSVIIPVLNEGKSIASRLSHLKNTSGGGNLELIVVDGGSSDGTVGKAGNIADQVVAAPKAGRAFQMHWGARKSRGDLLLFLHADTDLPEGWNEILRNEFSKSAPPPAAVAFQLSFDSNRWPLALITMFARFRNLVTGIPQGDQGLAVQREVYFEAGGFPDVPIMEEYAFLPKLKRSGGIRITKQEAKTSARRYVQAGPFRNALKNSAITALYFAGASPEKLSRWYRSLR